MKVNKGEELEAVSLAGVTIAFKYPGVSRLHRPGAQEEVERELSAGPSSLPHSWHYIDLPKSYEIAQATDTGVGNRMSEERQLTVDVKY